MLTEYLVKWRGFRLSFNCVSAVSCCFSTDFWPPIDLWPVDFGEGRKEQDNINNDLD